MASKKGKLIHLEAQEPVGISPRAQQSWSDTYARWSKRRKWGRLAPCICGRSNLAFDLLVMNDCLEKYPEHRAEYEEEMAALRAADEATKAGGFYAAWCDDGMPHIWVPYDYVDRAIIQRAIAWYMQRLGFERCRFKWRRTSGPVACPM